MCMYIHKPATEVVCVYHQGVEFSKEKEKKERKKEREKGVQGEMLPLGLESIFAKSNRENRKKGLRRGEGEIPSSQKRKKGCHKTIKETHID